MSTITQKLSECDTSFVSRKPATPAAPKLTDAVRLPHGPFEFRIHLAGSSSYVVEASTDLRSWIALDSGHAGSESIIFRDAQAGSFGYRFYRVVENALFSQNIVGFALVSIPSGFAMIANPFLAPSNAVSALLTGMPEGTTLSKFDTGLFRLTENAFRNGQWLNPNETLVPGEGAIVFNPAKDFKVLTYVGEVMQEGLALPIGPGFSIRSSQLPLPGALHTDLGFPLCHGDAIHLFDREQQRYSVYSYPSKEWDREPPVLTVGESFWIGKVAPCNWTRNLFRGALR